MALPAGYLNKLCTFKRRSNAQASSGDISNEAVAISAELTRLPCGYRPDRGWEREEAGRLESNQQGVLRVRSANATRGLRASDVGVLHDQVDGDTEFVIIDIQNRDRRNQWLHITIQIGKATY